MLVELSNGGGLFLFLRKLKIFFPFLNAREVVDMYITWIELFAFITMLIALIGLVCDNSKNDKKR